MDCLLIGGAQSVGKTEAVFRLTQNLLANGFNVTAGTVPATVADFTAILEGSNKSGQQIRILVNTATDTVSIINRLRQFYDNNGIVNILISSIRDHDSWPRAAFFRIMNISPATNHITEFPLAKITRRGTQFQKALSWYIQNIDPLIRRTLSLAPFNV